MAKALRFDPQTLLYEVVSGTPNVAHECRGGKERPGLLCSSCVPDWLARNNRRQRMQAGGKRVSFNIWRLRKDNEGHYTQSMIERDNIEAAKRDGREIGRPS